MANKLKFGLWAIAAGGLVALAAVTLASFSFDMDEFLPYHSIACDQAQQLVSTFQGACNALPTEIFGWEFQRSFNYAGAMSAWIMTPIFAVWQSWWSHALVGLLTMVLAAWGITKSLKLAPPFLLAGIAFLPLLFPTIHDTGPIRLALIVIAWTPVALRMQFSDRSMILKAIVGGCLVIGWIAATENKPFFLFLIPGTVLWTLACLTLTSDYRFIRDHYRGLLCWFTGLAAPCLLLLFVLRTEGMTYFSYLRQFPSPNDPLVNAGTGLSFLGDWALSAQRFLLLYPNVDGNFPKLLQSPINALPLSPDRGAPLSLLLTLGTIGLTSVLVIWAFVRCWSTTARLSTLLLLGSVLLFLTGAWLSGGGSVHHYVFAQIGVLGLILLAYSTKSEGALKAALTLVFLSWLAMVSILVSGRNPAVGPNVDEIMETAQNNAAVNSVINCASWGCYHQFAFLKNKPAPVVFAESVSDQRRLITEARQTDTKIIHVCRDCTIDQVQSNYRPSTVDEIGRSAGGWFAFKIEP